MKARGPRTGGLISRVRFLLVLAAAFLLSDWLVSGIAAPYLIKSGRFLLNDYEVVRREHPEQVWDKIFFGNSIVIASYLEQESDSGYINLGVDYGVVTDLWDMIRKGVITPGSDIVIGLNDLTLYDEFETNTVYPWHRRALEPYFYFERDRLKQLFTESVKELLTDFTPAYGAYSQQQRSYYYGAMSHREVEEKERVSPYANLPLEDFDRNFKALGKLAGYCREHGIRLRLLWMPVNPSYDNPESVERVRQRAEDFARSEGLEFKDMSGALGADCFYDVGHLNREYGAYVFTEEVEPWLKS